ncbi:hypothetical protein BJV78DRAFT_530921 [Lactifluus subvellereus]|nr:hypothetical protein BJV78DRAFT_530921 [Lactifluus subvellereus]
MKMKSFQLMCLLTGENPPWCISKMPSLKTTIHFSGYVLAFCRPASWPSKSTTLSLHSPRNILPGLLCPHLTSPAPRRDGLVPILLLLHPPFWTPRMFRSFLYVVNIIYTCLAMLRYRPQLVVRSFIRSPCQLPSPFASSSIMIPSSPSGTNSFLWKCLSKPMSAS